MEEDIYAEGQVWVVPVMRFDEGAEYLRGYVSGALGMKLDFLRDEHKKLVKDSTGTYIFAVPPGREEEIAGKLEELPEIDWAARRNLSFLERSQHQDNLESLVRDIDLDGGPKYVESLQKILDYVSSILPKSS